MSNELHMRPIRAGAWMGDLITVTSYAEAAGYLDYPEKYVCIFQDGNQRVFATVKEGHRFTPGGAVKIDEENK